MILAQTEQKLGLPDQASRHLAHAQNALKLFNMKPEMQKNKRLNLYSTMRNQVLLAETERLLNNIKAVTDKLY